MDLIEMTQRSHDWHILGRSKGVVLGTERRHHGAYCFSVLFKRAARDISTNLRRTPLKRGVRINKPGISIA